MARKQQSIGLEQARATLPTLTAQAQAGRISVITRHGKPVAAVVPIDMALSARRGRPDLLSLRGSGKGLWRGAHTVEALRAEWT